MLVDPARSFFRVRPSTHGFAAEIDAAAEPSAPASQPPRHVRLGHRRVGARYEKAFGLAGTKHVDPMLDPALASRQHDRRIRRGGAFLRRLAKREREQDEAEKVGEEKERN